MTSSNRTSNFLILVLGIVLTILVIVLMTFLLSQIVLFSGKIIEAHWGAQAKEYYIHTLYPVALVAASLIYGRKREKK